MSREALKWYDPNADNPPWIKALADVRHMGGSWRRRCAFSCFFKHESC
jgi:hypothetical protein